MLTGRLMVPFSGMAVCRSYESGSHAGGRRPAGCHAGKAERIQPCAQYLHPRWGHFQYSMVLWVLLHKPELLLLP